MRDWQEMTKETVKGNYENRQGKKEGTRRKIDAHLHLAQVVAGYCRRGELRAVGGGKAKRVGRDHMTYQYRRQNAKDV